MPHAAACPPRLSTPRRAAGRACGGSSCEISGPIRRSTFDSTPASSRSQRRERRGQDQPARSAVAVLARARAATRRHPGLRADRRRGRVLRRGRDRGGRGNPPDGARLDAGRRLRPRAHPSHRPRLRPFGARLRRPRAAGLAHPGDGPAAERPRERAAQIPRPARACGRSRPRRAGRAVRARIARPQPALGGGRPQRAVARRAGARRRPNSASPSRRRGWSA